MSSERNYPTDKYYDLTATIAVGQNASAALDLQGLELAGLFLPSTFDGTTLGIQTAAAVDGVFVPVQDGYGVDFTMTGAANKYVPLSDLGIVAGLRFIKLVATSTQTTTDTVITLALRSV